MAKRLTDILKTQPTSRSFNPFNKGGYHPHKGETGAKAFLKQLVAHDPGEPFENDFLGGVKQFDRKAHRFGHDNVDYNDFDNKGGLRDPNVQVSHQEYDDIKTLGEVFDAYFEENPDASFHQAYSDIMEELELLEEKQKADLKMIDTKRYKLGNSQGKFGRHKDGDAWRTKKASKDK